MRYSNLDSWVEPDANDCWIWLGPLNEDGYGVTSYNTAHVAAYITWVGPIPPGMEVHHKCEVRNCLNPDHLEAVTHQDNTRYSRGWTKKGDVWFCKFKHEMTFENTRWKGRFVECRECHNERKRQSRR